MKFQGFIGPSYTLDSVNVDCQRAVNIFAEKIESGAGKEGQVAYYNSTPGLDELMDLGEGPIRLILVDDPKKDQYNPNNRVFVVSGAEVYKCQFAGGSWDTELMGEMETATGPVKGATMQGDLGVAVFVDGKRCYLYWRYDSGDALIVDDFGTFEDFGYFEIENPIDVMWVDGYFIFLEGFSGRFWVSKWGSLEVDALSFATSEGSPDNLIGGIICDRNAYLFNERSLEVYQNTGNADFPFERAPGGFIEKGCLSQLSIAKIDSKVFWLCRDEFGQGMIMMIQGLSWQRISTHAIEQAIRRYAHPELATAYTYQDRGHSFYVLSFAEMTWVYDISTGLWHERMYLDDGEEIRHRGQGGAFFAATGETLLGDFENGKVYRFNQATKTDNGSPIKRIRSCPHVSSNPNRVFCKSLFLDMQTGVGLDGGVQGSDPQVILEYSDDGGHTWSSEMWASAGKKVGGIGDFKKRVKWNRLGSFYDRVFRVSYTEPTDFVLLGAELELEMGAS